MDDATRCEQCLERPPDIEPGDQIESGKFSRNLKKEHLGPRYERGESDPPEYGWKLNRSFWKDAKGQGDLSVNESSCILCPECSILLHSHSSVYYHVGTVDLGALNEQPALLDGFKYTAVYDPYPEDDEPEKPCHFEIAPVNGSTSALQVLENLLGDLAPPKLKAPKHPEEIQEAKRQQAEFERVLSVETWVRDSDSDEVRPINWD